MKTQLSLVIAAVGVLLATTPATAHHSFAAEFDEKQPITLKGTLTKMEWMNPHGWIYIDVKGPDGKVVNWAIETGGPNALLRRGVRKTDFPIGSEVTVTGYRAKSGLPKANGTTVKLADGRDFFLPSSEGGDRPPR
jgi:hypothetical protein